MPRLAKSTTVAAFIVSTPPHPRRFLSPFLRFRFSDSGAISCHLKNKSSSAFSSGPEHGASRSTASIAPAMEGQMNAHFDMFRDFLSYMER